MRLFKKLFNYFTDHNEIKPSSNDMVLKKSSQELQTPKKEKSLDELVVIGLNGILQHGEPEVKNIIFHVPGTQNYALLSFTSDNDRKRQDWLYSVGVLREGTDMLFSHYLEHGKKEAVIEYMKTDEARTQTIHSIKELSEKVDNHFW